VGIIKKMEKFVQQMVNFA